MLVVASPSSITISPLNTPWETPALTVGSVSDSDCTIIVIACLVDEHEVKRVEWVTFLAQSASFHRHSHRDRQLYFRDMLDLIRVELLPGMKMKIATQPNAHHKRHIEKIMLLSCVATPLLNTVD